MEWSIIYVAICPQHGTHMAHPKIISNNESLYNRQINFNKKINKTLGHGGTRRLENN